MLKKAFITDENIKEDLKREKIRNIIKKESTIENFQTLSLKPKTYITKEKIDLWNKKENETPVFKNNYPLINLITKNTLLNKSSNLLPKILGDHTKKILKCDEKMIKTINNNKSEIDEDYFAMFKTFSSFRKRKKNSIRNLYNYFPKDYKNNNAKNYKIKNYLKIHDINYFNKKFFHVNPLNSYEINSYKIKQIFQKDEFINKIKNDVSSLKFNSNIRANTDFF